MERKRRTRKDLLFEKVEKKKRIRKSINPKGTPVTRLQEKKEN